MSDLPTTLHLTGEWQEVAANCELVVLKVLENCQGVLYYVGSAAPEAGDKMIRELPRVYADPDEWTVDYGCTITGLTGQSVFACAAWSHEALEVTRFPLPASRKKRARSS